MVRVKEGGNEEGEVREMERKRKGKGKGHSKDDRKIKREWRNKERDRAKGRYLSLIGC